MCSAYTAELFAIKLALGGIETGRGSFLICTDSLSALNSISEASTMHPIVQEIHTALITLGRRGIAISFLWVPGHVGIAGNERADALAKEALELGTFTSTLVPYEDLKSTLRKVVMEEWEEIWRNLDRNKLREVKSVVSAWPSSVRRSRREEVAITRLRIGHCPLTHSFLFTEERIPPRCDDCDCSLSVRHILMECDKYQRIRNRLQLSDDIAAVLGDDSNALNLVLEFLKEIGLFNNCLRM
jgi:hypothetical protein